MNYDDIRIGTIVSRPKVLGGKHFGICTGPNEIAHAMPGVGAVTDTFANFGKGHPITIERRAVDPFLARYRALHYVRNGYPYVLFESNCEHFVALCENGEPESPTLRGVALLLGIVSVVYLAS